jgi:hypothetical protein
MLHLRPRKHDRMIRVFGSFEQMIKSWSDYYGSERFLEELRSLPRLFPCSSECPHTGVPANLRVLLDNNADTRQRTDELLPWELRCCWYARALITMILQRKFPEAHQAWVLEVFCPIPVANVGFGCVHGNLPHWLVRKIRVPSELRERFSAFFEETILGDCTRITGLGAGQIASTILADRDFQTNRLPDFGQQIADVLSRAA